MLGTNMMNALPLSVCLCNGCLSVRRGCVATMRRRDVMHDRFSRWANRTGKTMTTRTPFKRLPAVAAAPGAVRSAPRASASSSRRVWRSSCLPSQSPIPGTVLGISPVLSIDSTAGVSSASSLPTASCASCAVRPGDVFISLVTLKVENVCYPAITERSQRRPLCSTWCFFLVCNRKPLYLEAL